MVYRKGELTRRRILQGWPHHVLTPTPERGFGERLNAMHAFCQSRDYKTANVCLQGKPDGCWWCFRSEGDADAFRVFCAGLSVAVSA